MFKKQSITGNSSTSPPGSLRHVREAIAARHAGITSRQWQKSPDLRSCRWPPQTHRHHIMGRPANSVGGHHLLHSVHWKRPPTVDDTHHVGRRSIQRRHKLLKNLYVLWYQPSVVLQLQSGRECLLSSHVMYPVFWVAAEQTC